MPRYRYSEKLGSGAFGSVYACCEIYEADSVIEDGLAIKFLRDEWLDDEESRERFRRETRLLRRLKHPNILPIVYSNLSAERPYIVMPRAESNLADELGHNRAADREWALALFRSLLEAVAYAHEQDVLHRDLKPANVLFVAGTPRVSDFGMGKDVAADASLLTLTKSPVGTPHYMPPEQWTEPHRAGKPADVFALGKLLWELLANRPPAPGAPALGLIDEEGLRLYIARCCEDEPSLRYRDAGEALRAWDALVGDLGPARSPLDQAQELIEEWGRTDPGPDIKVTRRLDALLQRNSDEEQLYYDIVPYLPPPLLAQYVTELPFEFKRMLDVYAGHIGGDLPFSYCDDVAQFYAHVFEHCPDSGVRRIALRALLDLGPQHNRYPVADVVRALLWGIDDDRIAELAAEVIRETPSAVWYHHWQLFRRELPAPVKAAFDEMVTPSADDDIPF